MVDGDVFESRTRDNGTQVGLIAECKWSASDSGCFGSRVFRERLSEREKPWTMLNAFPTCDGQPSLRREDPMYLAQRRSPIGKELKTLLANRDIEGRIR